jgi:hypothetical protein
MHNRLRALIVVAVLMFLSVVSLAFRSEDLLADKPFTEDGYYLLSVSRNLAAGNGPTADGNTNTNGFQPLYAFLASSAFLAAGGEIHAGLRFLLLLNSLLFAATAVLVGLIVRDCFVGEARQRSFWIGVVAYMSAVHLFMQHFNGLGTGTALLLYAMAWRYAQTMNQERRRSCAVLGAILGLLVLARVDAACLVVLLTAREMLRRGDFLDRLQRAALIGGVALVICSPWGFYCCAYFGSLVPSSAAAQMSPDFIGGWERRSSYGLSALSQVLMPHLYKHGSLADLLRGVLIVVMLGAVWLARKRGHLSLPQDEATSELRDRAKAHGAWMLLAMGFLVVCYLTMFKSVYFYHRYFAPIALIWVVAISFLLGVLATRFSRVGPGVAVILAPLLLMAVMLAHTGFGFRGNAHLRDQVALVRDHVPITDRVGAGQSGTLGFMRPRVVNLDGKVNAEALRHQADILGYAQEKKIRWMCDWPEFLYLYLGPDPSIHGWHKLAERGRFVLYQYRGN